MWWKEVIGIVATTLILVSMSINTISWKGDVWMRIFNLIGSVVFVVYGCLLPAISTAILNGALIIVNIYHLIKLIKKHKNENENKDSVQDSVQDQQS